MPLYSRKDMPQVNTQNLGKALGMTKRKAKVTKGMSLAIKLKQSQKELIKSKVKGVAAKYSKPTDMKPLIISKDGYIIDGHHRWAAAIYKFGKDVQIPTHTIHLKKDEAIELYNSVAKSLGENITVPIKVGDTVLGGKFKNKRIVVKSIGKNEKGDITINNKPLLKFRLLPKTEDEQLDQAFNDAKPVEEETKRDYKKEYAKYGKSKKAKKYRAELNKYNRQKGTYGNGDGKDASHKGGKIVGFESASKNRGRKEKSRLKKESITLDEIGIFPVNNYLKGMIPRNMMDTTTRQKKERLKSTINDLKSTLNHFWKSHDIPYRIK